MNTQETLKVGKVYKQSPKFYHRYGKVIQSEAEFCFSYEKGKYDTNIRFVVLEVTNKFISKLWRVYKVFFLGGATCYPTSDLCGQIGYLATGDSGSISMFSIENFVELEP